MLSVGEHTTFSVQCESQMLQVHDPEETMGKKGPQKVQEQWGGPSEVGHNCRGQGKLLDDGHHASDGGGIIDKTEKGNCPCRASSVPTN